MSQTVSKIDPKQILMEQAQRMGAMYVADLKHIPEDKLGKVPMGAARTPLDFTAEVCGFNSMVAKAITGKGGPMPSAEEYAAFTSSFDCYDACRKGIESSVAELVAAVDSLDEEGLTAPVTTPWGQPTTAHGFGIMAISHMMYHDGQLNYIQSLYGDAANHWGE